MKVSVIIPCYNSADFIDETIQSIIDQDILEMEIICVDNGSTDQTLNILNELQKKDSRITIAIEPKKGASFARAKGFNLAKGDFIQFLDSDDIIKTDKLNIQMKAIEEQDVDWVVSDRSVLNHYLTKVLEQHKFEHIIGNEIEVGISEVITSGNPLYKKSALEKVGGYTPDLIVGQDWDLHIKLIIAGLKVGYIKGDFFHSRRLKESLSSNWVFVSDTLCALIINYKDEFLKFDIKSSSKAMNKIHQTYLQSLIHSDNSSQKNTWLKELEFWNQVFPISISELGKLKVVFKVFGLRTYIKIARLLN